MTKFTKNDRMQKQLGQHFLIDRGVRNRIISAADLKDTDKVIEIGPGRGFLTKALCQYVEKVLAVEIDSNLVSFLRETFDQSSVVDIIPADARDLQINTLLINPIKYKLVANLPYYAATYILRQFLENSFKPELIVVMIQREVAQTIVAQPGKMGILSVATQVYGQPRIICHVSPRSFKPSPSIWSTVLRIDLHSTPLIDNESRHGFFTILKAGFSTPRKKIRNSLSNGLGIKPDKVSRLLDEACIDQATRPQNLTIPEWIRLHDAWINLFGVFDNENVEDVFKKNNNTKSKK